MQSVLDEISSMIKGSRCPHREDLVSLPSVVEAIPNFLKCWKRTTISRPLPRRIPEWAQGAHWRYVWMNWADVEAPSLHLTNCPDCGLVMFLRVDLDAFLVYDAQRRILGAK